MFSFGSRSRSPHQDLLDSLPDAALRVQDGRVRHANPAARRVLDLDEARATGPLLDLVHPDFAPIFESPLDELTEEKGGLPVMMQGADGHGVHMHLWITALGRGEFLIYGHDLTESTRAAEDVLRSEQRHRRLVESAPDCVFLCTQGSIDYVNPAGLALLGVADAVTVTGRPLADFVHPDYRAMVAEDLPALAEEEGALPLLLLRADGSERDVEVSVAVFEAHRQSYVVEVRDISERTRALEAINQREQRLQGIMDVAADGIITIDSRGTIQTVNPAALRVFGYEREELLGQNIRMLAAEPDASRHDEYLRRYLAGGAPRILGAGREVTGRRRDGSHFPLDLSVTEMREGSERLFIGLLRDITDRKRAEEALRQAHADLEQRVDERTRELASLSRQNELILDAASEGILGVSIDGTLSFANPAAATLLGVRHQAMVGRPVAHVLRYDPADQAPPVREPVTPADPDTVWAWAEEDLDEAPIQAGVALPLRAALLHGRFQGEGTLVRAEPPGLPVEYAVAPILDGARAVGAVVLFRDITERRRSQETMRLAATVFDNAHEAVMVLDAERQVTLVNGALTTLTGYGSEDVQGQAPDPLIRDRDGERDLARLWQTVAAEGHWSGEHWVTRKDGSEYAQSLSIAVVTDDLGRVTQYVAVFSDITERKREEERIRRQASYDDLTGLPNRALFHLRLEEGVTASESNNTRTAVLFIDLDGFKAVNDTLGHDAGDLLLKEASVRLSQGLREHDTLARLGGGRVYHRAARHRQSGRRHPGGAAGPGLPEPRL